MMMSTSPPRDGWEERWLEDQVSQELELEGLGSRDGQPDKEYLELAEQWAQAQGIAQGGSQHTRVRDVATGLEYGFTKTHREHRGDTRTDHDHRMAVDDDSNGRDTDQGLGYKKTKQPLADKGKHSTGTGTGEATGSNSVRGGEQHKGNKKSKATRHRQQGKKTGRHEGQSRWDGMKQLEDEGRKKAHEMEDEDESSDGMSDAMEEEEERMRDAERIGHELQRDEEFAGDTFGSRRSDGEDGVMVAGFVNIRRFKLNNTGPTVMLQENMWMSARHLGLGILGLSDLGLGAVKGKMGHLSLLQRPGRIALRGRRLWGGADMGWSLQTGIEGRRKTQAGESSRWHTEGGTAMCVHSCWRHRTDDVITDDRGWGRFNGRVLRGTSGHSVVWVQVQGPSPGRTTWEVQEAAIAMDLKDGKKGVEDNPKSQFLRDLFEALKGYFGRDNTVLIVGGDFNMEWKENLSGRVFSGLKSFAVSLGLTNAMTAKHQRLYPTRFEMKRGKMEASTPDHILISRYAVAMGALQKVGVWTTRDINHSDHRMLLVEVNLSMLLRLDEKGLKISPKPRRWLPTKLYMNVEDMGAKYQLAVTKLWKAGSCEEMLEDLEQYAAAFSGWDPDDAEDEQLQRKMDKTLANCIQVLLEAEKEVIGPPRKEKKLRARRKELWCRQQASQHREVRLLQKLLHLCHMGHFAKISELVRRAEGRVDLEWLGTTERALRSSFLRQRWTERVQNRIRKIYSSTHKTQREKDKQQGTSRRKDIRKLLDEKKWGQIYRKIQSKVRVSGDRETVTVEKEVPKPGSTEMEVRKVVIADAEAVKDALRSFFANWMGENANRWFFKWRGKLRFKNAEKQSRDSTLMELEEGTTEATTHPYFTEDSRGFELRAAVANGTLCQSQLDILEESFPDRCRHILGWYKAKHNDSLGRALEDSDYLCRGLLQPITREKWESYVSEAAANKAPDGWGTHINLFKALKKAYTVQDSSGNSTKECHTIHVFDAFRRLLNVMLDTAHVFSQCSLELLCTLSKVAGSSNISDTRPIGLVEFMRNALDGIQASCIDRTWHETKHLSQKQNGFVRGRGTMQGRWIATTISEHCYMFKKTALVANQDLRHAFDSMCRYGGLETGHLRLSVPRRWVRMRSKMNMRNRMRVRTAHGLAAAFHRWLGAVQGGKASPQDWAAFEDPINTAWEQHTDGCFEIAGSEQQTVRLDGAAFADDKRFVKSNFAAMDSLLRMNGDFIYFQDIEAQAKKSQCQVLSWLTKGREGRRKAPWELDDDEWPCFYKGAESTKVKMQMVHIEDSITSLGEETSAYANWKPAKEKAMVKAHELACLFKQDMPRHVAYIMRKTVLAKAVGYGLMQTSLSQKEMGSIMTAAMIEYKHKLRVPVSTSSAALQAFGLGDFWHELNVDYMMEWYTLVCGEDGNMRTVAMAGFHLEQRWVGTTESVLDQPYWRGREWSGTKANRILEWLTQNNIRISGLPGLKWRRRNDACLVDLAIEEHKETVSRACWAMEKWRISEVMQADGSLRFGLEEGQYMRRMLEEAMPDSARDAMQLIRFLVEEWKTLSHSLGVWLRAAVASGSCVLWWDGEEWNAGRISQASYTGQWTDLVTVKSWTKMQLTDALNTATTGIKGIDRLAIWSPDTQEVISQFWEEGEDGEEHTIAASQCHIVADLELTKKQKRDGSTMATKFMMIDEIEEEMRTRFRMEDSLPMTSRDGGPNGMVWRMEHSEHYLMETDSTDEDSPRAGTDKAEVQAVPETWDFPHMEELMGLPKDSRHFWRQWRKLCAEADEMFENGTQPVLMACSDGSLKGERSWAKGTYGWTILGLKGWGNQRLDMVVGRGIVHGSPWDLSSTVCELDGVLSVAVFLRWVGWKYDVEHRMDNQGVIWGLDERHGDTVVTEDMKGTKELSWEWRTQSSKEWVQSIDPYRWAELKAQLNAMPGGFSCIWQKGHPEERKSQSEWDIHEKAIYAADALAETAYGMHPIRSTMSYSHQPTVEFWHRHTLIRSHIRQRMTVIGMQERFVQYLAARCGNKAYERDRVIRKTREDAREQECGEVAVSGGDAEDVATSEAAIQRSYTTDFQERMEEWVDFDMIRDMVTMSKDVVHRIMMVKVITGVLATSGRYHKDGDGEGPQCPCCSSSKASADTNAHLLWECEGVEIVRARKAMVGELQRLMADSFSSNQGMEVAIAFWRLAHSEGNAAWMELEQLAQHLDTVPGISEEAAAKMLEVARDLDGEAAVLAKRGVLGEGYLQLLQILGLTKEAALELTAGIHKLLHGQDGLQAMWKARVKMLHGASGADDRRYKRAKVLQRMGEIETALQREYGLTGIEDRAFECYNLAKKTMWLKAFDAAKEDGASLVDAMEEAYEFMASKETRLVRGAVAQRRIDDVFRSLTSRAGQQSAEIIRTEPEIATGQQSAEKITDGQINSPTVTVQNAGDGGGDEVVAGRGSECRGGLGVRTDDDSGKRGGTKHVGEETLDGRRDPGSKDSREDELPNSGGLVSTTRQRGGGRSLGLGGGTTNAGSLGGGGQQEAQKLDTGTAVVADDFAGSQRLGGGSQVPGEGRHDSDGDDDESVREVTDSGSSDGRIGRKRSRVRRRITSSEGSSDGSGLVGSAHGGGGMAEHEEYEANSATTASESILLGDDLAADAGRSRTGACGAEATGGGMEAESRGMPEEAGDRETDAEHDPRAGRFTPAAANASRTGCRTMLQRHRFRHDDDRDDGGAGDGGFAGSDTGGGTASRETGAHDSSGRGDSRGGGEHRNGGATGAKSREEDEEGGVDGSSGGHLCRGAELEAGGAEEEILPSIGHQGACILWHTSGLGDECVLRCGVTGVAAVDGSHLEGDDCGTSQGNSHMDIDNVDVALLCDLQHYELSERGTLLQRFQQAASATISTEVCLREASNSGRQDAQKTVAPDRRTDEDKAAAASARNWDGEDRPSQHGMVHGKSSGLSAQATVHAKMEGSLPTPGAAPVCIQMVLQETNSHLDEPSRLATKRHYRHGQMYGQLRLGAARGQGKVDTRLQTGHVLAANERGHGTASTEVGNAEDADDGSTEGGAERPSKRLKLNHCRENVSPVVLQNLILRPVKRRKTVSETLKLHFCNRYIP